MPSAKVLDEKAYDTQLQTNAALKWTAADILNADEDRLLTMQHRLGLGRTWGLIDFPEAFIAEGNGQKDSNRRYRLPQFLPHGMALDAPSAMNAWSEVLRFVVSRLSLFGPRRAEISGYSTCAGDLRLLKPVVRKIAAEHPIKGKFWSRIDEVESAQICRFDRISSLLRHYHGLGSLPDMPIQTKTVVKDEPERDRSDEPEHEESVAKNRQWQPLPMEFVSEMGWRSLRIVKSVAPTLLDALEAAMRAPSDKNEPSVAKQNERSRTRQAREKVISEWQWQDESQEPFKDLGFVFDLKTAVKGRPISWPPTDFNQAMRLAHSLVKPAHLWIVLLGNGNRNSEVVSMRTDCLVPSKEGGFRWKGRTYKFAGITGGREIEAEVPEIIGQSILQQIRFDEIVRLEKRFVGNALWCGETVSAIRNLSQTLNRYVEVLGLRKLLGDENTSCHEHRFRKTLARIVASALTNSIMILKDCFGHIDAVMTLLRYIASDPSIAQEVIKIQKELTIMMAVDVITDQDKVGGPAAANLRERAKEHLKRIGKSKFEPQDAYEFSRRETFDGRAWMMIAPGILCTAPHDVTQVSTPCAVGQKRHNPANCKTGCDWQLLLTGYYATQADDTVEYALKNLQQAIDTEDEASVVFWAGQAKAWLYRYVEVTEKWKDHPLVVAHVPRPVRITIKEAA